MTTLMYQSPTISDRLKTRLRACSTPLCVHPKVIQVSQHSRIYWEAMSAVLTVLEQHSIVYRVVSILWVTVDVVAIAASKSTASKPLTDS